MAEQRGDAAAGQRQVDVEREAARGRRRKRASNFDSWRFPPRRVEGVERQQHQEGEEHHAAGQPVGLRVFQRLDVVVDLHRDDARLARDVAADHQHHAEFADGVGEAEDGGGEEAGPRQRHGDAEEGVQRAGAQRGGRLPAAARRWPRRRSASAARRRAANRTPRPPPGRQKVKGSRPRPSALRELPDRPVRPHRDQQVEAQHRRRQHQRQRHHGADRRPSSRERVRASHQAIGVPTSSSSSVMTLASLRVSQMAARSVLSMRSVS